MASSPIHFTIGSLPICGDLILAPMDGITDSPYRRLARQFGSAASYTEFINAVDIACKHPTLDERLRFSEEERPLAIQLLDNDPDRMEKAASYVLRFQPDFIDINIGCCARTVSGRGAGAGLLREPQKISQILNKLTPFGIPVTAKIRLGWDENSLNYLEIAKIIEQNGGQLIAVHARTRRQAYTGQADWDAIAQIKQILSIPVIGNGDIKTPEDIEKIKNYTKCDGVMIARGAIGNPWIFSRMDRSQVPGDQVFDTILYHLNLMISFYGNIQGLIRFRKHANAYLQPFSVPAPLRKDLLTCDKYDRFIKILDEISLSNQ
ncbi:MAG: tRNA dihydrouridine synthase DusB [Anaerolineaceae bacterium]|nr:tRNA dihydrouridine synthase DusB [Anaerolineaceae bacterium]